MAVSALNYEESLFFLHAPPDEEVALTVRQLVVSFWRMCCPLLKEEGGAPMRGPTPEFKWLLVPHLQQCLLCLVVKHHASITVFARTTARCRFRAARPLRIPLAGIRCCDTFGLRP